MPFRRRAAVLFVLFAVLPFGFARAAAPVAPSSVLNARDEAAFDRTWERLEKRQPTLTSREIYGFLLNASMRGWRPERLADVIDLGERMHDRDPASPTYGNYRWYWHEARPDDRNAVEFCMQLAALTWVNCADRLPPAARSALKAAMSLGAEGMLRHRVQASYTNIFLMRLANCILVGEALHRPELEAQGRAWFDEWFAYTRRYGIHEYASPTYTGVDLEDLGMLARYATDETIRVQARTALRLMWTEIAANWFAPHGALGGARSRDYDFLTGHGELDWMLGYAGWIPTLHSSPIHTLLPELTYVAPPDGAQTIAATLPRTVSETWGPHPWEHSMLYVGRHFSMGTAGSSYGAQDKVFCIALRGGPKRPLITFSLDYRDDPYGRSKILTSGSHPKLTHLVPFVASAQQGPEALLLASLDPRHTPNPAGRDQPMVYKDLNAILVIPADLEIWTAAHRIAALPGSRQTPQGGRGLYLRDGDTAIALAFLLAEDDRGELAKPELICDGAAIDAARYTVRLSSSEPRQRVTVVLWARAAEGLDDAGFDAFRHECEQRLGAVKVSSSGSDLEATTPADSAPLRLHVDLRHERRFELEGTYPSLQRGILTVNGRDLGAEILR